MYELNSININSPVFYKNNKIYITMFKMKLNRTYLFNLAIKM